jgi:SAM-dependent methyltransferase
MSHWDERYAPDEYVFGTEPNEFLRDHADRIPPGRVLSLGEGEGRNAVFLAERGHTITAIDASPRGLAKARALADARGVDARIDTIVADLTDYEPEVGAYAGVISIFCHLPPPVRTVVHARAIRALAPGGVIVLEAYTPAQLAFGTGGPKDLALLYSLDELRADLDGLELEVARELERTVVEGPRHTGRAAVVEVVARKPLQR